MATCCCTPCILCAPVACCVSCYDKPYNVIPCLCQYPQTLFTCFCICCYFEEEAAWKRRMEEEAAERQQEEAAERQQREAAEGQRVETANVCLVVTVP